LGHNFPVLQQVFSDPQTPFLAPGPHRSVFPPSDSFWFFVNKRFSSLFFPCKTVLSIAFETLRSFEKPGRKVSPSICAKGPPFFSWSETRMGRTCRVWSNTVHGVVSLLSWTGPSFLLVPFLTYYCTSPLLRLWYLRLFFLLGGGHDGQPFPPVGPFGRLAPEGRRNFFFEHLSMGYFKGISVWLRSPGSLGPKPPISSPTIRLFRLPRFCCRGLGLLSCDSVLRRNGLTAAFFPVCLVSLRTPVFSFVPSFRNLPLSLLLRLVEGCFARFGDGWVSFSIFFFEF